jgi:hypothetical protein
MIHDLTIPSSIIIQSKHHTTHQQHPDTTSILAVPESVLFLKAQQLGISKSKLHDSCMTTKQERSLERQDRPSRNKLPQQLGDAVQTCKRGQGNEAAADLLLSGYVMHPSEV